ncbi:MAG: serine hydrolase domain-containing protein [Terracidiphilus sp.]
MLKVRRILLALALLGLGTWQAVSQGLPTARPEDTGFSAERLAKIDSFYADQVKQGQMAGIVMLIARHGKIAHFSAIGYADVEKHQPMKKDTIFRMYSMTKPIASVALMTLYEEGRFQMDDPISKYLPEFSNLRVLRNPDGPLDDTVPAEHPPTVQDILRHTAGFTHGLTRGALDVEYMNDNLFGLDVTLKEMMDKLSKLPLRYQPGTKFAYSVGPDVQARLVEVLSGMPFNEYLSKHLFEPLGMKDTGYWVPPDKADRQATVYWMNDGKLTPLDNVHGHPPGGIFVTEPWSVNSYTVDHKHKGGSYGLVSTAADYWRFAQMMLDGGAFNGVRVLSPHVVQYMATDHLEPCGIPDEGNGLGFGLGFAVMKNSAGAGYMSSEGTYFWAGAAATYFWIDPKEDMVVVALTQHMATPEADALPAQLRTVVYSALMQ